MSGLSRLPEKTNPCAVLLLCLLLAYLCNHSQLCASDPAPPRLTVVIAIDQFPQEYLTRFASGLSETGFVKQLLKRGTQFTNCHHEHAFTFTGPGHSVMLTGAYPASTGIIGNHWYDRTRRTVVNCVEDRNTSIVMTGDTSQQIGRSPRNLILPTVGDTLKLTTGNQSRIYSIAFKDRAAILMGGHLADGVYWFDDTTGQWITSSYYQSSLPEYIDNLNRRRDVESFAGTTWNLINNISNYSVFRPDDSPYEKGPASLGNSFPHHLPNRPGEKYYSALKVSPFANEWSLALAQLLIEKEELGRDAIPDILTIGLSANDYIGHHYGPYSLEVQDVTFRTDRMLGNFLRWLIETRGVDPLVIVTSDHGICPIPEFTAAQGLKSGRVPLASPAVFENYLESILATHFGRLPSQSRYIRHLDYFEIYLDRTLPELQNQGYQKAQRIIRDELLKHPDIAVSFTRDQLIAHDLNPRSSGSDSMITRFAKTFYEKRSGDILFAFRPFHLPIQKYPTTHGSPWQYDRQVILMVGGPGIPQGNSAAAVSPAQIAPTLAALLGIRAPAGSIAAPVFELLPKR